MLDAQSWALDFRGFVGGFDLEFDARYAEWLFALFESPVSEGALVADSTAGDLWATEQEEVLALSPGGTGELDTAFCFGFRVLSRNVVG